MAYNDVRTPEGHAAVLGEVTLDPETQELDYSVAHSAASQMHGWAAHKLATTEAFTLIEGYYQEALIAALAGGVPYASALSPYTLSGVVPPIGPGKHLVVHSALTPWVTFEDLELPALSTQVFDYVVKAYGYLESTPTTRVNETATIRVTRDGSGNASLLSLAAPFSDTRLRVTVGTNDITIDVQAHATQDWIWDTEAVRQLGGNATIRTILRNGTSVASTGVHQIPGVTVDAGAIRFWHGDETDVDVALTSDASTAVLVQAFAGLNASSHYHATFGFRVTMWQTGDATRSGSIDGQVDLNIATSSGSVATCSLNTTFWADTSRLPTTMAGATATMAPSTGGITISATRPSGAACRCSCAWWVTEFKELVTT